MNPAHLTTARKKQVMISLEKLEQSFARGNITKATYIQRKDDLQRLLNESRTLPNSNLATNPGGFFSRNVVNLSPAPVGFLNRFGLKKGQKALNNQVAPTPKISQNIANQMVNQGWNRANNTDIRKALLESTNRETWIDLDIQSALNNQETSYQTSVENAGLSGGLGLTVSNLPSYDRISKETTGTYQAEAIVHGFINRINQINFASPNVLELIEQEARSAAINLYYAQINPEDIQSVLVNAIVGTSSEMLNNYDAMEAVNKGAQVMNQAKNSPSSTLFNSFYNTFGPNNQAMNPSMNDPLKAIDLPTLYAMGQEATGNDANLIAAEISTRQDAMAAFQRSSKSSRIQNNATGRGYNTEQAIKNRMATNQSFSTSMEAMKAQKANLDIVVSDILTIDGKTIFDEVTGQFSAFTTEQELSMAIQGLNYAMKADYWDASDIQRMTNLYNALVTQLNAMAPGSATALPSASSMSTQTPNGQYSQSQQLSQQSQQSQQMSQQSQQSSQNLNQFSPEPPMPNPYSLMSNNDLKNQYGMMTQNLASDPEQENNPTFMSELSMAENEMSARGFLNNNGMQGAPRTLGILSGTLRGATTSTSTSSAHGAMRAHVANLQKDPRDFGLYD